MRCSWSWKGESSYLLHESVCACAQSESVSYLAERHKRRAQSHVCRSRAGSDPPCRAFIWLAGRVEGQFFGKVTHSGALRTELDFWDGRRRRQARRTRWRDCRHVEQQVQGHVASGESRRVFVLEAAAGEGLRCTCVCLGYISLFTTHSGRSTVKSLSVRLKCISAPH